MSKENSGNSTEMPKYQSHKQVWALKIETVTILDDGGADIVPADGNYGTFKVGKEYVEKHKPQEGGYYVQYEGGYDSWSPADAFEGGYTLLDTCKLFEIPLMGVPNDDRKSKNRVFSVESAIDLVRGGGTLNCDEVLENARKIFDYINE